MTQVVAALIWYKDKFMICRRPRHKARGLLWEFVGGKVEPNETKQAALIRECREELGVTLCVNEPFMEVTHEYPDITVDLTLYNARILEGVPQKLEHEDIRFITADEIPNYDFCPADATILERIIKSMNGTDIVNRLFELQDPKYRDFSGKLIPTVSPDSIIGVRTPELRKYAKEINGTPEAAAFLKRLPHKYYEENNLHAFLIEKIKDYGECVAAVDAFLPYIDNWATCDSMSPKVFKKHLPELLEKIKEWLASERTYTIRFGVEMLMSFYLDEEFKPEYLDMVSRIRSEEYYVNMMLAWYFATALAKQYEHAVKHIEGRKLDKWTHNKAIQKAIESYRITDEQKAYLRTLKG